MSERLAIFLAMTFFVVTQSHADDVDYVRDVKPLFAEKCGVCHGALKSEAGLRLDAGSLIRKGGDDGPILTPGRPNESELIRRISSGDPDERMPPADEGSPLTAPQIELLSRWISAGAVVPETEPIPADPRRHWAYQPPVRPDTPQVKDPAWSHPIDAFTAREHHRLGLRPVGLADRHTRLRRLYMDLIGLPPTRAQLRAFVEDDSEDAWNEVVDELLQSPHHGERWGRRWMDVWRYSDWDGYKQQLRGSQRHIWRWRDWIVQSLNDDKGYDQMIVEMLAGDEVAPADEGVLAATGFLARNYHKSNRHIWLDAAVEHTSKAFLGTTLNCARCHDHKFDPLPQTAYYQFRAIFEPHSVRIDRVPGQPNLMQDGLARAFDSDLKAETYLFLRGNDKHPDKDHPMRPAVPSILGGKLAVSPVELPSDAYLPALRDFVVSETLAAAQKRLSAAERARSKVIAPATEGEVERLDLQLEVAKLALESLKARQSAERAKVNGQADAPALAKTAAQFERRLAERQAELAVRQARSALNKAETTTGEEKPKKDAVKKAQAELAAAEKKREAAKAALEKSDSGYTPLGNEHPRTSSGRRLALARWIVDTRNPLTARVAVNHVWMRHFGSPLVANVFDFGLRSPQPPHAELLDWLAVELMEKSWSLKHLHRLILTSRTWQLASSGAGSPGSEKNESLDPDNRYLWRANVQRLDAEIVRDNLLAVGEQLDKSMGGADIDFRKGEESRRRSIYLRHAYEKQMTMLVLFDAASPLECYRRSESIIPQQALALSNSEMSLSVSRSLAGRLWNEVSGDSADGEERFVEIAFLQVLSRSPTAQERVACLKFLKSQAIALSDTSKLRTFPGGRPPKVKPASDPRQRAREHLTHVLMNHNDFVSVR